MAVSIAEMILLGLLADWLFRKAKMPGLLGMLLLGMLFGPHVLDLLEPGFLEASADLRMIALIIILLRAGFELSRETLNRVGWRAEPSRCSARGFCPSPTWSPRYSASSSRRFRPRSWCR